MKAINSGYPGTALVLDRMCTIWREMPLHERIASSRMLVVA